LADITYGSGTAITRCGWLGLCNQSRPICYQWPNQTRPPPSDWTVYQLALTRAFHLHPNTRSLLLALGAWIDNRNNWLWFYLPSDERLYFRAPAAAWHYHPQLPGQASQAALTQFALTPCAVPIQDLPLDMCHTVVEATPTHLVSLGIHHEIPKSKER